MDLDEIPPGYTRISNISSAFASYGGIAKETLQNAADRGKHIHEIIDDMMQGIPVDAKRYSFRDKSIKKYIESFERFRDKVNIRNIILQEKRFNDHDLKISGKIDLLVQDGDVRMLIDWKCTYNVGKHWSIQAAGYAHLSKADKVYFVKLDRDGGDPVVTEYKPNMDLFMKAFELYKMFFIDQTHNLEND